ncbi:polynucleotide kinase 3 phosphatase-domain-containing protein [Phlyctochytrium arcticum]|nr:polynucleotide kinase 3 phosphatase-domain-containing protein [Phlyctochytrium arcticum]
MKRKGSLTDEPSGKAQKVVITSEVVDEVEIGNGVKHHMHSETLTVTNESLRTKADSSPPTANVTPKKVHPFFAQFSGEASPTTPRFAIVKWHTRGSILIGVQQGDQTPNALIAAFDFDETIVKVKGTHVTARNAEDWMFVDPNIPQRLIELVHNEGYRIVFFSNQKGIQGADSKGKSRKAAFMGRVENVIQAIKLCCAKQGVKDINILAMGGTADDWNRKPRPGMWETFQRDWNEGVQVDLNKSFFVGDAAGRPASQHNAKRDFADTDYKFALNVGCHFFTPEAFWRSKGEVKDFLAESPGGSSGPVKHHAPKLVFNPFEALSKLDEPMNSTHAPSDGHQVEIVLLVGSPASGKSTFARRHFVNETNRPKYTWINQDTLKSRERCLKETEKSLKARISLVVDNTNPERGTRKKYLELAARVGEELGIEIPVRCFWLQSSYEICMHNNVYREAITRIRALGKWEDEKGMPIKKDVIPRLPFLAFRTFAVKFEPPQDDEGFHEIRKIDFIPSFENDAERDLWCKYLS